MLNIENLHVATPDGKKILNGVNLHIGAGEVHAIMGPNGSGKSTLANVIAGQENYQITAGSITYNGKNLLDMEADERACAGIFLAFQYPVEIPGVSNLYFLKAAVNAKRAYEGKGEMDAMEFYELLQQRMKTVKMNESFLSRPVNVGFSGGEKKRNEIMQMSVLEPRLAVLDETDSGLDIDALRVVSDGVNALRDPARSFLVITHYQRLLDYIVPDYVHVLVNGEIVESGDKTLALELEAKGYADFRGEETGAARSA
ncbi:Fe-S cluster assembly ATPase SufC [Cardiobacterium valvarum]|uniref:FeS assembly ATPase SufC n=2 Tax=Cardiobacterium valvarum TaxID=194702 RepID=G9ZDR9_9GAMM|nr:Fe-S cluster assembly ATPase SufC [Cardiobacterium valvarum]EHM55150.1 FeS assembly ATPase SufC [Cardiobacterium valvarum F0432]SUX22107.1 Probable ATP-dependent transporter SufC [Cardiobacterium valvarum]